MADHEDAALVFFKGALQLFFGVHIEVVERAREDTFNCHACCEMGVLIEISRSHMPGPLDRPLIRLQLSRFSLFCRPLRTIISCQKIDVNEYIPLSIFLRK